MYMKIVTTSEQLSKWAVILQGGTLAQVGITLTNDQMIDLQTGLVADIERQDTISKAADGFDKMVKQKN